MMNREEVLQELGFSKNEAIVYLALLNLGPSTAGKVAERCKLHRTNVYDALERLSEKGIVSHMIKENTKIFEATDPNHLKQLLDEKKMHLEAVLPQLLLDKQIAAKTSAHVYEGLKAFRAVFFNMLNYKETIVAYGIPKIVPDIVKPFIEQFHAQRIKKGIVMKHLYNENAKERIASLNSLSKTEARFLPEKFNSPVTTIVCGDETLIINWEKPITFIQIENRALADAYKKYFEILYSNAQ